MSVRIRPIDGGDKALDAFIQALAQAPDTLRTMSQNMAEETVGLIKDGFRDEKDPYGKAWAPKQRQDGRKVLSGKTSGLKGGWHVVRSSKGGFTVAPSVNYALPHQDPRRGNNGRLRRPRRAMVPYQGASGAGGGAGGGGGGGGGSAPLPPAWKAKFNDIAGEVLQRHFESATSAKGKRSIGLIQGKMIGLKRSLNWKSLLRRAANAVAGD